MQTIKWGFALLSTITLGSLFASPFLFSNERANAASAVSSKSCPALLQHQLKDINGKTVSLCDYQDKVLLVVNTASFCGNTPQYKELQSLYERYQKEGFYVLGFPANNFGKQEPGSDREIKAFCKEKYAVSFPLFAKSEVLGKKANPFYQDLNARTGEQPLWNFHKYLVDRTGQRVLSFSSSLSPKDAKIQREIEKMLSVKPLGFKDSAIDPVLVQYV